METEHALTGPAPTDDPGLIRVPGPDNQAPPIELYFGLVRAVGTDVGRAISKLERVLLRANLMPVTIRLSERLIEDTFLSPLGEAEDAFLRYHSLMLAGDVLRSTTSRGDAAALLGIRWLHEHRSEHLLAAKEQGRRGVAYIFRSLMHPGEAGTLRDLYGNRFFVVSTFANEKLRKSALRDELSGSEVSLNVNAKKMVKHLLMRDRGRGYPESSLFAKLVEEEDQITLAVDKTFEGADLFLDMSASDKEINRNVRRFVDLILGSPLHTPIRDEMGLAFADTARRRSGSLGRPVGAAIVDVEGEVVVSGTNEVAKALGGQYWEDDKHAGRDLEAGRDESDILRRSVFEDLVGRLVESPEFLRLLLGKDNDRIAQVSSRVQKKGRRKVRGVLRDPAVRGAQFFDVIEYGRSVHAEMAAIAQAARSGISVSGATLYCTTFPCHECAKHIVASGIERVVYIEPYPKSRVKQLFSKEIALAHEGEDAREGKVLFEPFMGVAPRRQDDLFSWVSRKMEDAKQKTTPLSGEVVKWNRRVSGLRPSIQIARVHAVRLQQQATEAHEKILIDEFDRALEGAAHTYGKKIRKRAGGECPRHVDWLKGAQL